MAGKLHQKLFDAFGPTAIGQVVAAVVIGALVGFTASRKMGSTTQVMWWIVLGGAGLGLVGAVFLILVDARRKRVKAGLAKPRGALFWVIVTLVSVVVFLGLCTAFIIL
ncbi:MAG TPA: hypothetical protein VG269_07500 [Tepidisphaeraceae bacterium]|jgi:hypothetical protein|nr:hypothetical protein [Tepidisphaeraceae bacterium]